MWITSKETLTSCWERCNTCEFVLEYSEYYVDFRFFNDKKIK